MAMTTIPSHEFNQDTRRAKKAAQNGPVFITDGGKPALVLKTIEDYQLLSGPRRSIVERLAMPGLEDLDLDQEIIPVTLELKAADFS